MLNLKNLRLRSSACDVPCFHGCILFQIAMRPARPHGCHKTKKHHVNHEKLFLMFFILGYLIWFWNLNYFPLLMNTRGSFYSDVSSTSSSYFIFPFNYLAEENWIQPSLSSFTVAVTQISLVPPERNHERNLICLT